MVMVFVHCILTNEWNIYGKIGGGGFVFSIRILFSFIKRGCGKFLKFDSFFVYPLSWIRRNGSNLMI